MNRGKEVGVWIAATFGFDTMGFAALHFVTTTNILQKLIIIMEIHSQSLYLMVLYELGASSHVQHANPFLKWDEADLRATPPPLLDSAAPDHRSHTPTFSRSTTPFR